MVFTCDGTKSSNSYIDKVNLFLPLILALANYKLGITLLEFDPITPPRQAPRLAPLPAPRAATSTSLVPRVALTPPLALLPAPCAAPPTTTTPRLVMLAPRALLSVPRAAPSTSTTPRAATPAPRVALSTSTVPRAASSTSATRFANPALVYHRRGSSPASAPTDPGPSTSTTRFAEPTVVYHRRKTTAPAALDVSTSHSEPPVYHSVAIHRDPGHAHPMVTRRAASVLRLVDRLILAADKTTTPLDASPVPSSVRAALADPHWHRAMEEYAALLANHTWDLVPRPPGTNVFTGKWLFRHKLTSAGSLDRYKARWVLRGFTQRPGVDYDETFSPSSSLPSVAPSSPSPSPGTGRSISSTSRMPSSMAL
jgi:hypothetical protein